jgi:hypothetical protein
MSLKQKTHAKAAAAVIGWSAVLWLAFWAAPYVYALNELIQWR